MKSFIIQSIISVIVLTSCSTKNTNTVSPNEYQVLAGYPWVLGSEKLDSYDQLNDSIYTTVDKANSFTDIVLIHSSVKIKYRYSPDGIKPMQDSVVLNADNEKYFSAKELLFKINNATLATLKNHSLIFFEGLEYDRFDEDIPVYWILQGS